MDKIRHDILRGTTKVGEIAKNGQERRLKWYVLVCDEKRGALRIGRRVMEMKVQWRR